MMRGWKRTHTKRSRLRRFPHARAPQHGQCMTELHMGERVRITSGTFENFEGEVESVDPVSGKATGMVTAGFSLMRVELGKDGATWQKLTEKSDS